MSRKKNISNPNYYYRQHNASPGRRNESCFEKSQCDVQNSPKCLPLCLSTVVVPRSVRVGLGWVSRVHVLHTIVANVCETAWSTRAPEFKGTTRTETVETNPRNNDRVGRYTRGERRGTGDQWERSSSK